MGLSEFRSRQKLIKFKEFFNEIAHNSEVAKDRLLQSSQKEVLILIYFLSLVFKGKIAISSKCHKFIKHQKRFLELESLFNSNNLRSLKDRKVLIRFTKVIALLLEALVL